MNNWFDEHLEVVSFGADGKEDKEMAKGLKAGLKTVFENEYVKEPGVCERCEGTGKIKITFEELLTGEPADKDPVYLPCSSCENTTNTCKVMYNVNGGE